MRRKKPVDLITKAFHFIGMNNTLTIEDYLKANHASGVSSDVVEGQNLRLTRWMDELNKLLVNVRAWLDELKLAGPVVYYEQAAHISEEVYGSYDAPQLKIFFGREQVLLRPVGTDVFGGLGRIDLVGKNMAVAVVMRQWGIWEILQREYAGTGQLMRNNYRLFDRAAFKEVVVLLLVD